MNQIGEVSVGVKVDTTQLPEGFNKARKEAEDFGKSAEQATSRWSEKLGQASEAAKNKFTSFTQKAKEEAGAFSNRLSEMADKAASLPGPLGAIGARAAAAASGLSAINVAAVAATASLALLTAGLMAAVREGAQAEIEFLRIQAVVKATGSAAGLTAEQVAAAAGEITRNTLATGDASAAAATKLLTFKSVQRETFTEALKLSQDLAAVGFGSMESAATQLGRALEDPVNGISALRRAGVSFSAVQKQQIKDFMEAGQQAKAQALVLSVLRQQVGGAGEAEAAGLVGAYHRLSESVAEFLENIGNSGPVQAMTWAVDKLAAAINGLNAAIFQTDTSKLNDALSKRLDLQKRLAAAEERGVFGAETAFNLRRKIDGINEEIAALEKSEGARKADEQAADAAATAYSRQAEEDRKLGLALEQSTAAADAAAAAAKALAEARAQAISSLQTEISILGQVNELYKTSSMSIQDITVKQEILQQQAQLQLSATSAEGKAIEQLILQRQALMTSIDAEIEKRNAATEAIKAYNDAQSNVEQEIQAMEMRIHSMDMASQEAETFRVRQELLNAATKAHGELTSEQIDEIDKLAIRYGEASGRVEEYQRAQEEAQKQADRMAESQLRMQEALAGALTDALTGADNAGEAMARFAEEIAKAIIQAQILKAIQGAWNTPIGGSSGGGGLSFGGILSAGASLFGGFGFGGGADAGTGISSVMASRMHTGGTGGIDGQRMNAPADLFIGAPKFHNGLKQNEFPAILEKGEEVIPKDQVGRGGARVVNQTFNITTPNPDAFRSTKRQISREAKQSVIT